MLRLILCGYNYSLYVHRTINTILNQNYGDWKAYIRDDCSNDGSQFYLRDLIKGDKRFNLICNTKKLYVPGNYYEILQNNEIKDNDICVSIDLDDWLPENDNNVFDRIINYYKKDILMSFGQFIIYHNKDSISKGFSKKPEPFNQLRKLSWSSSHLRTFKAFLFRKINKQNLLDPITNEYWKMAGDAAIYTPMIEMAGEDRILYTDDINYIYNLETNLNDHDVNVQYQIDCYKRIMQQKSYNKI